MENSHSKLRKLKIFRVIQKNLSAVGIDSNSGNQFRRFNEKNIMGLLKLSICIAGSLMYIFNEAKTFLEYTQSIYMCSTFIIVTLILIVLIFNLNELSKNIQDCERIANTSKSTKNRTQIQFCVTIYPYYLLQCYSIQVLIVAFNLHKNASTSGKAKQDAIIHHIESDSIDYAIAAVHLHHFELFYHRFRA